MNIRARYGPGIVPYLVPDDDKKIRNWPDCMNGLKTISFNRSNEVDGKNERADRVDKKFLPPIKNYKDQTKTIKCE